MRKSSVVKALAWSLALLFAAVFMAACTSSKPAANSGSGNALPGHPAQNPRGADSGATANNGTAASPPKPIVAPKPANPVVHPAPILPIEPIERGSPPAPPPSNDELIEQSLAKLKHGNLAYNTPQKMKTGETARVTARIASGEISLQTLEAGLPSSPGSATATASTPISTRMKMTLKSADFDITPLSSDEQIVGGDTPTEWEWDVIPKHSGTLSLHLAAVVELGHLSRDFTSVDREIPVQVDAVAAVTQFMKANTVWLLTSLGAAIATLWAWWKRRRKPKTPGWETPD